MGRRKRTYEKPSLDWRYSPSPKKKKSKANEEKVITITVNSMRARFEVGCKLNLLDIATRAWNTTLKEGIVTIQDRLPELCSARFFPSGKVMVDVRTHDPQIVEKRCRNFGRLLQKLGYPVQFYGFRIFSILASTKLNYRLNLSKLAKGDAKVDYHPELNAAAFYSLDEYSTSLTIQHTGSLTIFCKSNTEDMIKAIEIVEDRFYPFRIGAGSNTTTREDLNTRDLYA